MLTRIRQRFHSRERKAPKKSKPCRFDPTKYLLQSPIVIPPRAYWGQIFSDRGKVGKALMLIVDEFSASRPNLSLLRRRMGIPTTYLEHRDLEKVDFQRDVPNVAEAERNRHNDLLELQRWLEQRWDQLPKPGEDT